MTEAEKKQVLDEIDILYDKLWDLANMMAMVKELIKSKRQRIWDSKSEAEKEITRKRAQEVCDNFFKKYQSKEPLKRDFDSEMPIAYDSETEQHLEEILDLIEKDFCKKFFEIT